MTLNITIYVSYNYGPFRVEVKALVAAANETKYELPPETNQLRGNVSGRC